MSKLEQFNKDTQSQTQKQIISKYKISNKQLYQITKLQKLIRQFLTKRRFFRVLYENKDFERAQNVIRLRKSIVRFYKKFPHFRNFKFMSVDFYFS